MNNSSQHGLPVKARSFDSTQLHASGSPPISTNSSSTTYYSANSATNVSRDMSMPEKIDDTLVGYTLTSLNIKSESIQIDNNEVSEEPKNDNDNCFEMENKANDENNLDTNEKSDENGDLPDHADDWLFYS
jgi:hypothetical protein